MKNVLLIFALMVFPMFVYAQLQVEKVPGETVTISWTFAQTDEAQITGFKVLAGDSSDGTFTELQSTAANIRKVNFPAAATAKFYKVVTYKSGPPEQQSEDSYIVLVNIRLKGVVGVSLK